MSARIINGKAFAEPSFVAELNANDAVDGILVQLPLAKQIDELAIVTAVDPATGYTSSALVASWQAFPA